MDRLTPEQRSKNMAAVKSKDTKPELRLRKELWRRGLRYRKNCGEVIGKPDIIFPWYKIAVFCDGEFWHGYDWEKNKSRIKSNTKYWHAKINRNMERDNEVNIRLQREGWILLRYWEHQIRKNLSECADEIEAIVREKKAEYAAWNAK